MNDLKRMFPWLLVGLAGALAIGWAFPRAFPLFPVGWTTGASKARTIGLERLHDLMAEDPVKDPYVVVDRLVKTAFERRLLLSDQVPIETLQASALGRRPFEWRVTLYPPAAPPSDWAYRATISPDGDVVGLQKRVRPEERLPTIAADVAIEQANELLKLQGHDLAKYREPTVQTHQTSFRTDLTVRYVDREALLGEAYPYGLEVQFAGNVLAGFESFFQDPQARQLDSEFQTVGLLGQAQFLIVYLMLLPVAVMFLRRYHAGEIGVRQGLRIFLVCLVGGVVALILVSRGVTEGQNWGVFPRSWVTVVWSAQFFVVFFFPIALAAAFSWSVGESLCREGWGHKLAAFDALIKGDYKNATVARSTFRGFAAGLGIAGLCYAGTVWARPLGAWGLVSNQISEFWFESSLPALSLLGFAVIMVLVRELVGRLLFVPLLTRTLGRWLGGLVVAVGSGILLFPTYVVFPTPWTLVFWVVPAAIAVVLFLRFDLLTVLVAGLVFDVMSGATPLMLSHDLSLQTQGWLALAVAALPMLLSLRYLGSGEEFVYRYDDIPPHVRRIAERERQRVELETARRIQSSILPELPPRLAGMDIAHAYLPASEVGGDFYDVLALEDGRLAIAIGDVAGHGVSSGLVMSGAKSALAVQVTFDPEVLPVFHTLNRMVYQSARKRLITTLCYALVDPVRREMTFASAGHLYPYVVSRDGRVRALQSTAYPLGVRPELDIAVTKERLESGDTLVMLSDGIVEAHPESSPEPFGFQRIEKTLSILADESVSKVRDGLLSELQRFVGAAPREDDQTLLVLRLP